MSDPDSHTFSGDLRKAAHPVDGSRVWALLLGINTYPFSDCPLLHGCVNDAGKMAKFLIEDLGVPNDHIQCFLSASSQPWPTLLNTIISAVKMIYSPFEAFYRYLVPPSSTTTFSVDDAMTSPTRTNIINALLALSTNPNIQYGDNIIIYFSGHGSSYFCSEIFDVSATGTIEAICPMDRGGLDDGMDIPDISDREINTILTIISRTKGHHITVILDCCHSAGATREPSIPPEGLRGAIALSPISLKNSLMAAHTRLEGLNGYSSVHEANWTPDTDSHVVLAACTEYQRAEEREFADHHWGGIFTQALIDALKSDSLEKRPTYLDLLKAIKMPTNIKQKPVVAGTHKDAFLWYQTYGPHGTASTESAETSLVEGSPLEVV